MNDLTRFPRTSLSLLWPRKGVALALLVFATTLFGPALPSPAGADDRGLRAVLAIRGKETLVSTNSDRLLAPASLQKMIVVAAALHHLGPDHRFATVLRGDLQEGQDRIEGDLFVVAAGDPTWSARFSPKEAHSGIHQIVEGLRQRGIRYVEGDLVIDVSRFPGRSIPKSRSFDEAAFAMGSPTSALAIDENTVEIRIAPGKVAGDPGTLEGPPDIQWTHHILTVGKQRHEKGTVDFLPRWGSPEIFVRGEYPVSEPPYRVSVSVPNPDERAGAELLKLLRKGGIEIRGGLRITATPTPAGLRELARSLSPPLIDISVPILEESVNWLAEMLLRLLAVELTGEGRSDTGIEILGNFLEETVGIPETDFHLDDASGVSPYNLITVGALVDLLRFIADQEWNESFLKALPSPGEGTLEAWPALPPLAAKTGTLRHTAALAGFLRPESSLPVLFAVVLDHRTEEQAELRREIALILESLDRSSKGPASENSP